jgi:hypothetical protein
MSHTLPLGFKYGCVRPWIKATVLAHAGFSVGIADAPRTEVSNLDDQPPEANAAGQTEQ